MLPLGATKTWIGIEIALAEVRESVKKKRAEIEKGKRPLKNIRLVINTRK